jgi:hypothetical protein
MKSIIDFFNRPLLKVSLIFGVINGVVSFLFFLGLYFIGIVPLGNNKVLDLGIHFILMIGACWYYRKNIGQGMLHLWEALTICYVVNCVGALLLGWCIYAFVTFVDPAIFDAYLAEMTQLLLDGKEKLVETIGQAEYKKMFDGIKETKRETLITDEISKKTVISIIPILIISLIFRKQNYGVYQNNNK